MRNKKKEEEECKTKTKTRERKTIEKKIFLLLSSLYFFLNKHHYDFTST